MSDCYLVREEDGTSRFILEDGSGFLLLEECEPPPPGGGPYFPVGDITPPQRVPETRAVMYRIAADEDEFVLYLLTRL